MNRVRKIVAVIAIVLRHILLVPTVGREGNFTLLHVLGIELHITKGRHITVYTIAPSHTIHTPNRISNKNQYL